MTPDKRTREEMLFFCDEIHEDDGIDPRQFFKLGRTRKKEDRKAKQLCRQVAQTLDQVLSGESGDEALRSLKVASVVPAPDSSRLLVTLYLDDRDSALEPSLVDERLAASQGRLRCEVSAAITRRKTPVLVFKVVGSPLVLEQEASHDD